MDLTQGLFYKNMTRSLKNPFQNPFSFHPVAYFQMKPPIVHILSHFPFPLFDFGTANGRGCRGTATKAWALL